MMDFATAMLSGWMIMLYIGGIQVMFLIVYKWMQLLVDLVVAMLGVKRSTDPTEYEMVFTYDVATGMTFASFIIAPAAAWVWAYQTYGDATAGAFVGVVIGLLLIVLPIHRATWGKWRTGMFIESQHALADKMRAKLKKPDAV